MDGVGKTECYFVPDSRFGSFCSKIQGPFNWFLWAMSQWQMLCYFPMQQSTDRRQMHGFQRARFINQQSTSDLAKISMWWGHIGSSYLQHFINTSDVRRTVRFTTSIPWRAPGHGAAQGICSTKALTGKLMRCRGQRSDGGGEQIFTDPTDPTRPGHSSSTWYWKCHQLWWNLWWFMSLALSRSINVRDSLTIGECHQL